MTIRALIVTWMPTAVCLVRGHRHCKAQPGTRLACRCGRCHRKVFSGVAA